MPDIPEVPEVPDVHEPAPSVDRVLVTGGAGFIGSNLVRRLVADPEVGQVVALDDLSTGDRANLEGVGAELVEGSVLDSEALDRLVADASRVVHLAARPSVPRSLEHPVATHAVNATGTLTVLEAARRHHRHVVVASSSSVYGANPTLPKHEDLATRPVSPYAASKLATEAYALAYAHSFGLGVMAFRFFNVFGPRQPAGHAYAAVVPAFVHAALTGVPLTVHGDGTQTRDFTFVDTVCEVLVAATLDEVTSGEPVNLAFGTRTDLLTVIAELEDILGCALPRVHTDPRPGDVPHSQADNRRLRALFPGIEPTPLRDGLAATVAWMRTALSQQATGPAPAGGERR